MRWWIVAVSGLFVVMVVALVLGIQRTQDDTPGKLTECVEDLEAAVVRGPDVLGPLRADLANERPPRMVEEILVGDNDARLYEGTGYRLLLLEGRNGAPLDDRAPLAAYENPANFSVVAIERDPVRGALAGCASITD